MTYWCNCDTCDYYWGGACAKNVPCEKALTMPQHKELLEVLEEEIEQLMGGGEADG